MLSAADDDVVGWWRRFSDEIDGKVEGNEIFEQILSFDLEWVENAENPDRSQVSSCESLQKFH
jgi:hypothetical protein